MFLHLGANAVIAKSEVVAILSLDASRISAINSEFISYYQNEGRLVEVAEKGKEKSLVLTAEKGFLSPISTSTLARRVASWREFKSEV